MLLDAHNSAQSAELLLKTLEIERYAILSILSLPSSVIFSRLQQHLVSRFQSPAFRTRCQFTQGETACLFCARKEKFLWWLSIGDCAAYLLHPELARQGQFGLNQRSFYEWIGNSNTFDLAVPSYSSGVRELRAGPNLIVMTTDGLLEGGSRFYDRPENLYREFTRRGSDLVTSVSTALNRLHEEKSTDSATMLAWRYENPLPGLYASKPNARS